MKSPTHVVHGERMKGKRKGGGEKSKFEARGQKWRRGNAHLKRFPARSKRKRSGVGGGKMGKIPKKQKRGIGAEPAKSLKHPVFNTLLVAQKSEGWGKRGGSKTARRKIKESE